MTPTQPRLEPDHAPPPGVTLRQILAKAGMSQRELATRTGLTAKHVNQVLNGVVTLSADVADRLELATGVPARLWNRLEADYRSILTREEQAKGLSSQVEWVQSMPVKALVDRGMLPATPNDTTNRARQLLAFFGVATPDAWRVLWLQPNAAFRQSPVFAAHPSSVAAWLRQGELLARERDTSDFSAERLREAIPELRALTRTDKFGSGFQEVLATAGVALEYVEEIKGARVAGATFWLGPGQAAILLSNRHKTEDVLFFTLFHEVGHLLLHGRREAFVDDEPSKHMGADPREGEADKFAANTLIPPNRAGDLAHLGTIAEARAFAEELGISSAIVVGRLHREGRWPWSKGAKEKRSLTIVGD